MKFLCIATTRSLYLGLAAGLGIGLAGGIADAAIPATNGVISACVTTTDVKGQHLLTLLDTAQSAVCQTGQALLPWNQTGPAGPRGDPGAPGPSGAPGPKGDVGPAGADAAGASEAAAEAAGLELELLQAETTRTNEAIATDDRNRPLGRMVPPSLIR